MKSWLLTAALLGSSVPANTAVHAAKQVDASAASSEVAAFLYAAPPTTLELNHLLDGGLRGLRARIEILSAEVAAGDTQRLAELTEVQRTIVAQLTAQDLGYAQTIAQYRDAVAEVASTREGLVALRRFNSGDQIGALAMLDGLRVAHDAARSKRSSAESAAEGRRIAILAVEALAGTP